MNRREAIKTTALGVGALSVATSCIGTSKQKGMETQAIGVQLFTIPMMIDQDFRGTLKKLSEIGYKEVEFFGPYPASSAGTKEEFKMLQQMLKLKQHAFYGYSVKDTAAMLREFGLTAPSMHVNIKSLRENPTQLLDELAELKPKYIVVPAIMEGRSNLDDYKKLAAEFNSFGEQASKYGMKFLYHNHGYEHQEMSGAIPMDFLIENTNPDYVQFELDIFWMAAAGADPIAYLKKYPGRYKALHIKDSSEKFRFAGNGDSPQEWMGGFPKMADPGSGIFDIESIIAAANKNGVDHWFLERDLAPQPEETLQNSYAYLSQL
ncbi:MAG: sugar phosphate isomerase/epimerase [Bacteroidota bacterium]